MHFSILFLFTKKSHPNNESVAKQRSYKYINKALFDVEDSPIKAIKSK